MKLAALAVSCAALGCAATSPLLVEPRLQHGGDVRMQVGAAAVAPIAGDLGEIRGARDRLGSYAATPSPISTEEALPAIALAFGARPGVAPVIRSTVGLSKTVEANVHYGGRDISVGGRWLVAEWRSADAGATTLSIGAVGRTLLRYRPADGYLGGVITDDVRGFGGSVPVILGWQSDAGLLIAYLGAIVGYEQVVGRVAFGSDALARKVTIEHVDGAAILGVGVGFRKLRVGVELGARRDWLDATIDDTKGKVSVISLTPAFALGFTL